MAKHTAQERRVRDALSRLEPEIAKAWAEVLTKATMAVDRRALIAALSAGDIERAVSITKIDPAVMTPLYEAVRGGFIAGGNLVAADLPNGLSGSFAFNGRHQRAETWVAQNVGGMIQGIESDTLEVTRNVIRRGIENGTAAPKLAREITGRMVGRKRVGGYLGLTSEQTDSIVRGRSDLLSGDPARMNRYMTLKQRNRQFDPMIKMAIKAGKPMSGADLDRIIDAHKSKAAGYRGRIIARTEARGAIAGGRDEAYQQLQSNQEVEAVTIRWQHNLSQVPREDHVAMSGTVINQGETFDFSGVAMKYPHDPAGGAEHNISCRCIGVYRTRLVKD